MDKLEAFQKASVERIKDFSEYAKKNWQAFLVGGLTLLFVLLLTVVIIPNSQRKIRIKEVDSLVGEAVKDVKQVTLVPYDGLEKLIRKESKLALALVDPNDANYPELISALNDESKMSQYGGELYVYPIVYDQKKTTSFYQLKAGITLIYFEDQTETERTELVEKKEIDLYLVDHLNSLSRGTVVKQGPKAADEQTKPDESTTGSTGTSTSESTDESEEVIDELQ